MNFGDNSCFSQKLLVRHNVWAMSSASKKRTHFQASTHFINIQLLLDLAQNQGLLKASC